MNASEHTKIIIENNDTKIFNALCDFLRDNKDEYLYDGDYCHSYPFVLSLLDYKLLEQAVVSKQDTNIIELLVEASIRLFDIFDLGLHRIITERFRIDIQISSESDETEVVYIGRCLSGV